MGKFTIVDFLYTIDPAAEEPIMTILGEIGVDVKGDQFCKELLFLDTLGKSKINVWIHSEGGTVTDAEKIIAAILKSKTKVDTHNLGLCASCAGPVFLAGRRRYMVDYGKFMMHPISGAPDMKSHKAFEDSVVTMLTSRSGLSEETMRKMMNETTWLNAKECEALGFCEIDDSNAFNKPRKPVEAMNYADYLSIVNKQIDEVKPKNTIQMKKVTNKLNLNEAANEDAILAEIEKIENRAKSAEGKLVAQETENSAKVEKLTNEVKALTEAKNKAEQSLKDIENKAAEEKAAALKAEAKSLIEGAVKAGKIENKAETIEKFTSLAEKDIEATKEVINALPVNKVAPKPATAGKDSETAVPYTAAGVMAQIAIKNKQTRI